MITKPTCMSGDIINVKREAVVEVDAEQIKCMQFYDRGFEDGKTHAFIAIGEQSQLLRRMRRFSTKKQIIDEIQKQIGVLRGKK